MNKILIVGSGNIGFWHLQGILMSGIKYKCYVFDSKKSQLKKFKKRLNTKDKNIIYIDKYNLIPKKIDLAIFATTSKGRYNLVKKICKKFQIKKIILEKVVEQNSKNLNNLMKISKEIEVFVSLPLRCSNFFRFLKRKKKKRVYFAIKSKVGDLASNAIHFLDAMVWISSKNLKKIDTTGIQGWHESKRKGYKEFQGTVKFLFDNKSVLKLINNRNSTTQYMKIMVDENKFEIFNFYEKVKDFKTKRIISSNNLSVSQIMKKEIKNILSNKKTKLPKFHEVHEHHCKLVNSLLINYNRINKSKLNLLPIS